MMATRTQSTPTQSRRRDHRRRAAVSVELVLVLPLYFLVVWGLFEFGRLLMVANTIVFAAQEGARAGVVPGSKTADVTAQVQTVLSDGQVSGATVTTSPAEVATLKTGETLTVSVQIPFSQVTWLPTPQFLSGKVIKTSCTMLREGK